MRESTRVGAKARGAAHQHLTGEDSIWREFRIAGIAFALALLVALALLAAFLAVETPPLPGPTVWEFLTG